MKILFRDSSPGIFIAILSGLAGYLIRFLTGSPVADPLVVSLLLGIILRTYLGDRPQLKEGLKTAPGIFIPAGIIFYGANNLNFMHLGKMRSDIIIILLAVMVVYFGVIFFLGKKSGQKDKVTCLAAAGSAICGASAIAVTSPAVEADADDISISLLSVTVVAFTGVSMILPFLSSVLNLSHDAFCELAGSVLQFTGLVRIAPGVAFPAKQEIMPGMVDLALTIKTARYLVLIIAIPVFASLIRKRLYIPWYLWAFLLAGLAGTVLNSTDPELFSSSFVPLVKPVHNISWSIAMAAIGLNADVRKLLSNSGAKTLIMSFAGFFAAVMTFLAGYYLSGVL